MPAREDEPEFEPLLKPIATDWVVSYDRLAKILMGVVTIRQAKTHLSHLIQEASSGKEIIIARGAKPVARLVPLRESRGKRRPGSLKNQLRVGPEFFESLPSEEISGWE